MNPAGSVKDRIGAHILARAESAGLIEPGFSTLVEATAGNTGIALAAAAASRGYGLVVTMTDKMGPEKVSLMQAWGAEIVICPYNVPPEHPSSFINTAMTIAAKRTGAYYVDQFNNPWNIEAHYLTTGPEIHRDTNGSVGAVVAGIGTGGTLMGIASFLRDQRSAARIVLADPVGSILADTVAGGTPVSRPYLVEGIGGDFVPGLFDASLITDAIAVRDRTAIEMCLRLQRDEGLFLGGSSGCAAAAAVEFARSVEGRDLDIVVILADGGGRYLSTIYSESWRQERFGAD